MTLLALQLTRNTVEAYARSLQDFFTFSEAAAEDVVSASRGHIAAYVLHLSTRPRATNPGHATATSGLANATLLQRLTAVRLFYDYLIEEGDRDRNPVGRGRYVPGNSFGGMRRRGLVMRVSRLPWIPNDEQWQAIIASARGEPLRNRLMLPLTYDAALRREELCLCEIADFDMATAPVSSPRRNDERPSRSSHSVFRDDRCAAPLVLA